MVNAPVASSYTATSSVGGGDHSSGSPPPESRPSRPAPGELGIKDRRSWQTWQLLVFGVACLLLGMLITWSGGSSKSPGKTSTGGKLLASPGTRDIRQYGRSRCFQCNDASARYFGSDVSSHERRPPRQPRSGQHRSFSAPLHRHTAIGRARPSPSAAGRGASAGRFDVPRLRLPDLHSRSSWSHSGAKRGAPRPSARAARRVSR